MSTSINVIIPTYREYNNLPEEEKLSLQNTLSILSSRTITLLCPDDIDLSPYKELGISNFYSLPRKWFYNRSTYSALLENYAFYNLFLDSDYIFICHTDGWVFRDDLDYFMEMGYDYYGAPIYRNPDWAQQIVGNGGMSLRSIKAFSIACERVQKGAIHSRYSIGYFEDAFFCLQDLGLNICPEDVALTWSWEMVNEPKQVGYSIPMCCHGFYCDQERKDYWKQYISILK